MSFRTFLSVCGIALSIALGFAVAADDKKANPPKLTPEEAAAVERINAKLDKICFIDIVRYPLEEQCRDFEKTCRFKFVLDPEELKKAGVAKDVRITLKVKDIPLSIALHKLFVPVGLDFEVRPDGLLITAKAPRPNDPQK